MKKNEFLDGLRTALTGELPDAEVESNIRFYDDYIKTKSSDKIEEVVMDQLGDPRLIAKTIVETYQISHGALYNSQRHERAYQDVHTTEDNLYEDQQRNYDRNSHHNGKTYSFGTNTQQTWYQKIFLLIVAILIISLLVLIGGVLIQLFFSIGIPLLIVYGGYKMIKNSMRK